MQSLESKIRDFILTLAKEQDTISQEIVRTYDRDRIQDLTVRKERFSKLASECLWNIDKEIDFFKNN